MTTTKQYNMEKLHLANFSDAMKWICNGVKHDDWQLARRIQRMVDNNLSIEVPVKAYAVSVVERFISQCCEIIEGEVVVAIDYIPDLKHLIIRTLIKSVRCNELYAFHCPTNPFDGLVNDDGTPVTSVTKETLEMWKREVVG